MPNDAPFKLPLTTGFFDRASYRCKYGVYDADIRLIAGTVTQEGTEALARIIVASPKLVAIAKMFRESILSIRRDGGTLDEDDLPLIDEALALADPAFDPNKDVMDAVAGRAAKDAGIEVADGN